MLDLQKRDYDILQCCYEQKFLLLGHVERFFFTGCATQNARQRVLELEKSGLLRIQTSPVFGRKKILRLTQDGKGLSLSQTDHKLPYLKTLDTKTLSHDAFVTTVRLRLSELWDGIWIPELALKGHEYADIPDGVFLFNSGKKVLVEIENSLKGKSRYRELFLKLEKLKIFFCLYVATEDYVFNSLKRLIEVYPKNIPLGLISLKHLETKSPIVFTKKGDVNLFSRRSF